MKSKKEKKEYKETVLKILQDWLMRDNLNCVGLSMFIRSKEVKEKYGETTQISFCDICGDINNKICRCYGAGRLALVNEAIDKLNSGQKEFEF